MRRVVLLMVLIRATAPHSNVNVTEPRGTEATYIQSGNAVLPTVFQRILPTVFLKTTMTQKPHRQSIRRGKADSPMLNYIFDSYATSNKHFHDNHITMSFEPHPDFERIFAVKERLKKRYLEELSLEWFKAPSFEGDTSTDDRVLTADTGATVIFDCRVSSLRDKMVSWIRVSDNENLELLTLDLDTHTADGRYRVDVAGETWRLSLADVKVQDSGIYCCHVSTHPPMLRRFKLTVYPPEIKMNKEAFLESGETLSLKCAVLHLSAGEVVPELRWYRGSGTTPLDEIRGGVLIETDHLTFTSHLQVARLKPEDAGNYTCALEAPLQMKTVARVHVLQGSSLAELQSGVKTTTSYMGLLCTSLILLGTCYDVR